MTSVVLGVGFVWVQECCINSVYMSKAQFWMVSFLRDTFFHMVLLTVHQAQLKHDFKLVLTS